MKPGLQTGRIAGAAVVVAALSGCFGLTVTGTTFKGRGTVATSSQTSTSAGGTSSGVGASTSGTGGASPSGSGGLSSGGGTSSGGAGSTSGLSSGGSSTGFADGGYVFCTVPGLPTWLCTPGTYFCDSDDAGVCFQCLSDADCADRGRPTYDPMRPHCDLHSGVTGYQNFCQVCLVSADCADNPSGPLCDISPNYPPAPIYQGSSPYGYSSTEPPIVDLGFETCGILQTDCRVDGGPICRDTENERCEPDSGLCVYPFDQCSTDADCVGLFSGNGFPLEPEPYCVMGYCNSCLNGNCPGDCLSNLQCSGLSPRCENLDAGFTNDAGLPLGFCGCDTDDQCGDAGLICSAWFCGVPCTAPNVPDCASVSNLRNNSGAAFDPFCNPSTGLCEPCTSDQQCQADPASGGPVCSDAGRCGCRSDSDCPSSQTCQGPPPYYNPFDPAPQAICVPSLARCTPDSCGRFFCDWETGECLDAGSSFDPYYDKPCLTDYDCASSPYVLYAGLFCDPVAQVCTTCNTNADCAGLPSSNGSHCFQEDAGVSSCGCLSDADCAGNPAGPVCDTTASDQTFHSCGCRAPQDCQVDQTCPVSTGLTFSTCSTFCTADTDCQSGYACDPGLVCRAHCEGQPCPASEPVCDSQGGAGQNGRTAAGPVPYIVWCYQCLAASECSSSECDSQTHQCGPCQRNADCPAGEVCHSNQCVATCVASACPAGQVCDTNNLVGGGADLCYECVSPIDCPSGEGCSSRTHTCGRCDGPNAYGQPYFDCPPGAVCSNYWSESGQEGVCLTSCDLSSCPADQPICAVLPALTPDHKYCFGCLQDSDCASLGAGAWCDVSVGLTFSCQVPQ